MSMQFCLLVFLLIATLHGVDDRQDEVHYLAHATDYTDEIALFFGNKSQSQLEKLIQSEHLRISVYAAWLHCQRRCFEAADNPEMREHRAEFLGFLSGRLNITIPAWWKDAILSYAVTESHDIVQFPLPIKNPDGFHTVNGIVCASHVVPVSIEPTVIHLQEDGKDTKLKLDENWGPNDWFYAEDDVPNALTTAVLPDNSRIIGLATELDYLRLFCMTDQGTKLWSTSLAYSVDNEGGGESGQDIEYQLIHAVTTPNRVALFWVCRQAISFTLLDINTGAEILRFSTKVNFRK